MATGAKTIAFLVGPKNERLLLTDTETKALEPLLTLGLDVHYLPSLEKKGDVELAHRAAKNQIAAVFVFNPSSISRHMNTERFFALVEKCWASNTPLAMNQSLIDLCLNDLIAIEGHKNKSKRKAIANKAVQGLLLTSYPYFDEPRSAAELQHRTKVSQWTLQQHTFWLDQNGLSFLKPLVDSSATSSASPETRYFEAPLASNSPFAFFIFNDRKILSSIEFSSHSPSPHSLSVSRYCILYLSMKYFCLLMIASKGSFWICFVE